MFVRYNPRGTLSRPLSEEIFEGEEQGPAGTTTKVDTISPIAIVIAIAPELAVL